MVQHHLTENWNKEASEKYTFWMGTPTPNTHSIPSFWARPTNKMSVEYKTGTDTLFIFSRIIPITTK